MTSASIGIDCGSTVCKGVLMQDGAVVLTLDMPTGWNPRETSADIVRFLLEKGARSRAELTVTATGYGRALVPDADKRITEITCHARGAEFLRHGVRTVIDIGGQDSKVIAVREGRASAFQMNDKCAAGTGRFLEMTAGRLSWTLEELGRLSAGEVCPINSMCAVFADSEIVSLLASGRSRQAIAGGVIASIASRTAAIAAKIDLQAPVLMTGGLASLDALALALEARLNMPIETSPLSRFAGAIGAALLGTAD
ncbi:MAG: acyl-CoA dehydratase activase [Spirochaetaceae bacterium]|jgi:predicted CoA-substrate-specific enzyme activase|nr:acyl-CoA dehydratase activase [Spirochaetaceae bacterium]